MAAILQLQDGTTTFDFNDGTTLSLGAIQQMNVGGGTVTELVVCVWEISDVDNKGSSLHTINQMLSKAVQYYRQRRTDRAVWLRFRPEGTSADQYALVQGGSIQEVRNDIVGREKQGILMIEILREGYWRDTSPGTAYGTQYVNGTTIYNKSDTDGDSWVDVTLNGEEVDSLPQIVIDAAQNYDKVLVAYRTGSTAFLNKFNPWFNPADNSSSTSTTADTDAPADEKISFSSSTFVTWDIAAADLDAYIGRFLVYGWVKQVSGGGSATTQFSMTTPAVYTGPEVDVSSTTGKTYLGTLASFGPNYYAAYDSGDPARIKLDVTITGTATVEIYGLWFIPLDYPPFEVEDETGFDASYFQWIDSSAELVYELDGAPNSGTTDWRMSGGPINTQGVYPRVLADPDAITRFYLYFEDAGEHEFNDTADIDVYVIVRYLTIKGGIA